jgi:hypothetical protein
MRPSLVVRDHADACVCEVAEETMLNSAGRKHQHTGMISGSPDKVAISGEKSTWRVGNLLYRGRFLEGDLIIRSNPARLAVTRYSTRTANKIPAKIVVGTPTSGASSDILVRLPQHRKFR